MQLADFEMMETTMPKGVQAVLDFGDYELSIVKNEISYGNKSGLFEIAVFKNGDQVELPGITEKGNTVKGFLTESDVNSIITKLHTITNRIPRQI